MARTFGMSGSVFGALLVVWTAPALGANAVIVQPASASTTASQLFPISNTVNQSGLSAPYTSGVTEFDTYVASTTHFNANATLWKSIGLVFPIVGTLDLGSALRIDGLALWGTFEPSNPSTFDVYSDDDADFTNGGTTLLGSYTGPAGGTATAALFAPTTTRYLHIQINGNQGGVDLNIGEFAVRQCFDTDGDGVPDDEDNCPDDPNVTNITQGTIYGTIGAALAAANPGDVLELGPCVFHEAGLSVADNDLTLRGQGMGVTIIDGDYASRIMSVTASNLAFEAITFREGLATTANGGAVIQAGAASSFTATECEFTANDGDGNAFSVADWSSAMVTPRFIGCVFHANFGALASTVGGGGVNGEMVQCLFYDEGTIRAGYIINTGSLTVTNCTMADNLRFQTQDATSVVTVQNSAFTTSTPLTGPGIHTLSRCVYPGATGNNVAGTPIFENAGSDDYRLGPGSPGIDAADYDAFVLAGGDALPLDLAGQDRTSNDGGTADTGSGAIGHLDCGAYEFQGFTPAPTGACCLGGGLCMVGASADCVAAVGTYLGDGSTCAGGSCTGCPGDLDGDGDTDVFDFGIFASGFGCAP